MEITFIAAAWGCPGDTFADQCHLIAQAGFSGIEVQPEKTSDSLHRQAETAAQHGLQLILQPHSYGHTPEEHRADLSRKLDLCAAVHPALITCHTGLDHFGAKQNLHIAQVGQTWSAHTGIPVLHEIHRKRLCHNAIAGNELLDLSPDIRFTADFSHWVVSHENYLDDPGYQLSRIFDRCDHIHARVGHPQSPQVPDPRLPAWSTALNHHLAWWDAIVNATRRAGRATLFICPEFGPPPYCPTSLATNQPLVDVFALNCWMRDTLQARYAQM